MTLNFILILNFKWNALSLTQEGIWHLPTAATVWTQIYTFDVMKNVSNTPDFTNKLSDKRLEKRANKIAQAIMISRSSSIHGSTRDQAEQKGFYRFLDNESVNEDQLISAITSRCSQNVMNRDVLVIQDSSSYGLSHLKGSAKEKSGLGLVGNKGGLGFLTHTSLVLDAHTESVLGYSDIKLWHRTEDKSNNTTGKYKSQPIEEKESYKWIQASNQAKQVLHSAKSITIIQDREGDIYQQFCQVPDERTELIIRSRDNRRLADGSRLDEALEQVQTITEISIPIIGDLRKEKKNRIAQVAIKICQVDIQKPEKVKDASLPKQIRLYALEAKEINPASKSDNIHWRILTTIKLNTKEDALSIIMRYKQRWYIEQLFRLTKRQGFKIEQTQLETGWAIRKLYVMVLSAAIRVMQLYLAYDEEKSQDITEVFNEEEIKCLRKVETHLQKTNKTTNPNNPQKLAWASWIIARLGGWKGNSRQRRPGPIILLKGVEKFENMFEGWQLANMMI